MHLNEFGQGLGSALPDWRGAQPVEPVELSGRYAALRPLTRDDAGALFSALAGPGDEPLWTYRPEPTPASPEELATQIDEHLASGAVAFAVFAEGSPRASGRTSLIRVDPANGVLEIGYVQYGASLQRTRAATETTYLLLKHAFDVLGYRRVEWKCNRFNEPSKRAAERMGFTFEGTFRNAVVTRGRSRDTDWFAMTDDDWPAVRSGFDAWLVPTNFDADGVQLAPLVVPLP